MRKIFITILISMLLLLSSALYATEADNIIGKWYSEGERALCEVYKNGNTYEAKFISFKDGELLDERNPDKSLRTRPLKGVTFITGLIFEKGQWENGKIYSPEHGKTVSCFVKLASDGKLHVRGYLGAKTFGKTEIWTKF